MTAYKNGIEAKFRAKTTASVTTARTAIPVPAGATVMACWGSAAWVLYDPVEGAGASVPIDSIAASTAFFVPCADLDNIYVAGASGTISFYYVAGTN